MGRRPRGPNTAAGKAAVRLNPLKHGMLSQTPVIPLVEDEDEYARLRAGIAAYFEVAGTMEEVLADIITMLVWRRCRLVRFETQAIARYLEEVPVDYRRKRMSEGATPEELTTEAVDDMDRMMSARLLPGAETAEKVMRYETRMHRFLLQTIHQLLVLQELRRSRRDSATLSARHDGRNDLGTSRRPNMQASERTKKASEIPNSLRVKGPSDSAHWGHSRPRSLRPFEDMFALGRTGEGVGDGEAQKGQAEGPGGTATGVLRADADAGGHNRAERRRRARRGRRGRG